jgi:endonuclease/exonuclease/phosphatase (EEP) superfamily protein YafD
MRGSPSLVDDDVPSVEGKVVLRSGVEVALFGLHPRPPRPQEGSSTQRDAELILVARRVPELRQPVVVMGDLNDVAWSHTSRLFRRLSRLLDPRAGRGFFSTFPVELPFLRFPLDHIFHSESLRLVSLERLPDIGSDHFPLLAVLQ